MRRPAGQLLPDGLAAAALLLSLAASLRWPWLAVTVLALVAAWALHRPPALGAAVPARALLAAGVLVQWDSFLAIVLVALVLTEPLLYHAARPVHLAANLRCAPPALARSVEDGTAWLVNSGAVALAGLLAALRAPVWSALLPVAVAGLLSAAILLDAWHRRRTGHRIELGRLRQAVAGHDPRFLLYFAAPAGSEYQATMWLPYLERIGLPFVVVIAEPEHLPAIARATRAPVAVHRTVPALEAMIPESVRVAFYVNNGMKNAHCVRFTHLTHVQLYHGYSDKPVSVNPIAAIFDRIYVPGQAIVDQFGASGVDIPKERFRIVGRPQAEALAVSTEHVGRIAEKVVLYAPTWAGEYADSNHCSLPIGEQIVGELLQRGATVIVRPHPYTKRDPVSVQQLRQVWQLLARDRAATGRDHRWGAAVARLSLTECMNSAHALICDVSSVGSQFLYSDKPFAITDMVTEDASFSRALPLGRAAYVIRRDAGNLPAVLDDLLVADPQAPVRRELRGYFLGDFPPERYVDGFLTEARRCITGHDR
jgi:CDP-glycerol:poly(glycerophosphate) glycerophosphotransferase